MPPSPTSRPAWITQWRLEMGAKVREARMHSNLTQEGLAGRLGLERRAIVRLELGDVSPATDRIFAIAHILGVAPADLMPDTTIGPDKP